MQALGEAVGLGSTDPRGAVLEEQLVGMTVGAAAELASVVAQDGGDPCLVGVEGGEDVVVHDVDGGDRELVGVERAQA